MSKEPINEKAEIELLKHYKELSDHAKDQIDRAWKAYGILARILGIIISVGLIVLYFLYGNSYELLEKNIREKLSIVSDKVEKRIETEFADQKIKDMIQKSANDEVKKRIDVLQIKNMIDKEVNAIIENQINPLNKQIKLLKNENEQALQDLSSLTELNLVLNNATYEIKSLRRLKEIAANQNYKLSLVAEKSLTRLVEEIERDYKRLRSDYWGWKDIDDEYFGLKSTQNWKLADYINNYNQIPNDQRVIYVYKHLSNDKVDENSKLEFSNSVLKTEIRPEVLYVVCAFLNSIAKLEKNYLFETEEYLKWLDENRKMTNNLTKKQAVKKQ